MFFLSLVLSMLVLISCDNDKEKITGGFSTVKGIYNLTIPWPPEKVKFSKIMYGKEKNTEANDLTETKKYGFTVPVDDEGFYLINSNFYQIPLYLKGNEVFNVSVDKTKYIQENIPNEENKVLYEWMQLTDTLNHYMIFAKRHSSTYKDFFPFYESFIPTMKAFHKKVNTSNPQFNKLMNALIDLTIVERGLYFLYTPRSAHPGHDDIPDFYKEFGDYGVMNSTILLQLPKGISALRMWDMFYQDHILNITYPGDYTAKGEDADRKRAEFMKKINATTGNGIKNDTLRAFLILEKIKKFKTYNKEYTDYMARYRKDIALSDYVKKQVEDYETSIVSTEKGFPGLDFTYKDVNGKEVSFSDFKGKLVYVDVWATWCSPCKQQIPYLKKLEEEYQGKDIQFISVSIDKPKDKAKWEKFVKKEKLGGVQLFADNAFDSQIKKYYKINAIPRFLLFDKEGNIIDAHAPRPSNPEIKDLLNSYLK